ncbi:MAG: hypothetical protein GY804_09025 [Alphaproteobacteria bacterium]|nr:hypothetical protein [Alphaproteobacteria bacterium]
MGDKKILIGGRQIVDIFNDITIAGAKLDAVVSTECIKKKREEFLIAIAEMSQGQIALVNGRLAAALDSLQEIIDYNDSVILATQTDDNSKLEALKVRAEIVMADIDTLVTEIAELAPSIILNQADIIDIESKIPGLLFEESTGDLVLGGSSEYFYPIWWMFPEEEIGSVTIDKGPALHLEMEGIGGMVDPTKPKDLRIIDFTETSIMARLISMEIYNYPQGGVVFEGQFDCPIGNCVYLQGANTYQLTSTHEAIISNMQTAASMLKDEYSTTINAKSYYYSKIHVNYIEDIFSDPRLKWLFKDQYHIGD